MSTRPLHWSSAARSHVGMVRKVNEDACLDLPSLGLWAVADGMGGHEAGDVASQMIIADLARLYPPASLQEFIAHTKDHLRRVNQQLIEKSARHFHNRTIGSTVVVLLAYGDQCACLWVGDSRIYRLRDGQLRQLTRDHSHVQELIDQGLIDPESAHNHPLGNVITRAVGSDKNLEMDVKIESLQAGDVFLLCSDGLNKVVSDQEIADLLASYSSQDAVQTLIHTALARGANDNVTTAVIRILDADEEAPSGDETIPIDSPELRQRLT